MSRTPYVYALYDGDKFIDLGTKKELAERNNLKESYIHSLTTPRWRRKRKEGYPIVIKIGRTDDNLEE